MGKIVLSLHLNVKLNRKTALKISISLNHLRSGGYFGFFSFIERLGGKPAGTKNVLVLWKQALFFSAPPPKCFQALEWVETVHLQHVTVLSGMSGQLSQGGSGPALGGLGDAQEAAAVLAVYPVAENTLALAGVTWSSLFWSLLHKATTAEPQE